MILIVNINGYINNNRIINRNIRLFDIDKGNNNKEINYCVEIQYCTGCKWLLRSAWLAQELLTTFEKELDNVSLKPDKTQKGYHHLLPFLFIIIIIVIIIILIIINVTLFFNHYYYIECLLSRSIIMLFGIERMKLR